MVTWVSLISPFLVLAGWWFVYRNSNRIATRAETYALVTKALDKVLEIDKRCVEFWGATDAERDAPESWIAGTLSQLHAIRTLLEILERYHRFSDKHVLIMKLRMASTLNAESVSELSVDEVNTKRLRQAEALSYALHSLYGYYRENYD